MQVSVEHALEVRGLMGLEASSASAACGNCVLDTPSIARSVRAVLNGLYICLWVLLSDRRIAADVAGRCSRHITILSACKMG